MLSKTEFNYLKGLKRFSGMPDDQIEFELVNMIGNHKGFDILRKQLEKANKEVNKLKEQSKLKDKELFKLKHESNMNKVEKQERSKSISTANVHQLKRIMCLLESESKPMNQSEIAKSCSMVTEQTLSALNFLVNNKLVKKDGYLYSK